MARQGTSKSGAEVPVITGQGCFQRAGGHMQTSVNLSEVYKVLPAGRESHGCDGVFATFCDNYGVVSGSRATASTSIAVILAPYQACTALLDKDTTHTVTNENWGLWSVVRGTGKRTHKYGLPISNRGIAVGMPSPGAALIQGGSNRILLCSFQVRKAANIPPENRGYGRPGSNLLRGKLVPGPSQRNLAPGSVLLGNGYGEYLIKAMVQQAGGFGNYVMANISLALASCCLMCYIRNRKRESHRSGYPPNKF